MDKNELVRKMKQGEIGFMDDPEEEQEVWEAFKIPSDVNIERRRKELQEIAGATLTKRKRISIPINERDLFELKTKALEAGIPYQTLAGTLIHHYVNGKISVTL